MLYEEIKNLEFTLLQREIRSDPDKIAEIIDPNFIEFCSSGGIYRYQKGATFHAVSGVEYQISDFAVRELAANLCLATYKAIQVDTNEKTTRYSLRSSIWRKDSNAWKLVFHQGTPCEKDGHFQR